MRLSSDSYCDANLIVSDKECKELEQGAMKRLLQARLELAAANNVLRSLLKHIIEETLCKAGIYRGCKIIVEYSDGAEEAVFEEVLARLNRQIAVRHLTKKGKPCKAITYLSYGMEKCIKLKTL